MKHLNKIFITLILLVLIVIIAILVIYNINPKFHSDLKVKYEDSNKEMSLYYELENNISIYLYGIKNLEIFEGNQYISLHELLDKNSNYIDELTKKMEEIDISDIKVELTQNSFKNKLYQLVIDQKENKGIRLYKNNSLKNIIIGDLSLSPERFSNYIYKTIGEVTEIVSDKAKVKLKNNIKNVKNLYIDNFSYQVGDILLLKYQTNKGYIEVVKVINYNIESLISNIIINVKADGKYKDYIALNKDFYEIEDFLEYYDYKYDGIRTSLKENQNVELIIPSEYTLESIEAPYTNCVIDYKTIGPKVTFKSCTNTPHLVRIKSKSGNIITIII